ncbi:alpha/beta hydrolase [Georgenia yuyongxinii]|uniref:alpha/beta hydrolase n=1 Tax=Georgenia yuyongxinii TaxID=2589797 RepID=UPI00163D965A|nr:alpha/beta hydrolase-fold protein [Georgenia yuyongxinii]
MGIVRGSGADKLLAHLAHQHGILTSPLVGTVLLLVAVVLGVGLVRKVRRAGGVRRLGATTVVLRGVAATGVVALAVGAYVNAYAGYLPTAGAVAQLVQPAQATTGGHLSSVQIPAPSLGIAGGSTEIYTPAGYESSPGRRYPVIYLITGSPGTPADWFRAGRVDSTLEALTRAHVIPPAIVVAMGTGAGAMEDTEYLNVVGGPQVETYYTDVVIAYIDAHYRTVPDRAHRVVGGISSGGFGALNVGLHHLDLYSTILAFEPYGDPGPGSVDRLLGGDLARYRANSPAEYIRTMDFSQPVRVFLDVGGATGRDVTAVQALARDLTARGQVVRFRVEPGEHHTWSETAAGLPYGLAFAGDQLRQGR